MWPFAMLKRSIIFVHRWLGVALCVLFLLWFPSGIGMMYWTFPSVTATDRLERAPALDPAEVVLSPVDAAATLGIERPGAVRLNSFDGRPVYRFSGGGMLYADTGEEQFEVSRLMVPRVASAWTGQPASAARVESIDEVDQWTVQASLRGLRPLWKYSWPNGEQVYVSEATGEVVQYTTTASRIGAYLGPIPHWFYFTPLRKHGPEWSRLVIWSSGIGTIAAMLGIVVGLWMYSPSRRYRYDGAPSALPYHGQKRWHTVLGLVFGVATATYAFSGMLSMDPFPTRTGGPADGARGRSVNVQQALRGRWSLDAFEEKHPADALRQLSGLAVKELELTSFAGQPVYMATLEGGDTRIVPLQGEPQIEFPRERIVEVVSNAAEGRLETRLLEQYDLYYLDRNRERPLPVILAQLTDGEKTRYYIDPKTARVVGSYDSRNWVNRWLYTGLHSLNFPWLYNYRPLWDIVVITLMLGGTALCVTSLVLAWRVLGRTLARAFSTGRPSREARLSEDPA
jgi:hypothetical protein